VHVNGLLVEWLQEASPSRRRASAWRWPCATSPGTLRETGESKGHNASFTRQDRSCFLQALEEAVQATKRDR
jgi:hypothetical protein